MDLRIQKTLENIETEFLKLRSKTPLNKIRISELCANAKINKSTFYRYYTDIFDLSEKLENSTIDLIMDNFTAIDDLFTNPEKFIDSLLTSIGLQNEKITILFGDRIEVFSSKIEDCIKSNYLAGSYSAQDDIVMSFLIGGAAHVFLNPKFDFKTSTKTIAHLLEDFPSKK
jgi:AcrR family transcriptional regulator